MNKQVRKQQYFMHLARYRVEDLRRAGLTPENPGEKFTPALADTLNARLTAVCEEHGWEAINIATFPDRIEALLTGMESAGETGEEVAAVLDGAVYTASTVTDPGQQTELS